MLKDISYIFDLADQTGTPLPAANQARAYYAKAVANGFGDRYFPSVVELVESDAMENL